MISFVLMMALGIGQFIILKLLLGAVLKGDFKKTAIYMLVKFALYGAVLPLVFLVLKENIYFAAAGFCVGLPGAVAFFGIFTLLKNVSEKKKGDESR